MQRDARSALCALASAAIDDANYWAPTDVPEEHQRIASAYLAFLAENLAHSCGLLRPGQKTFSKANLTSHVLRSTVEVYARLLKAHQSSDRDSAFGRDMASDVNLDLKALGSAASAGSEVDWAVDKLKESLDRLPDPKSTHTAPLLRDADEYEMLTVFQWESGVIHIGGTYLGARRTAVSLEVTELDVFLSPPSLWRIGQLTWASWGTAVRSMSLAAQLAERHLPRVDEISNRARNDARAAALRDRPAEEPPSPRYGDLEFPAWP